MKAASKEEITQPIEKSKSYWGKWYVLLIVFLLVQVIIYYFITVTFS